MTGLLAAARAGAEASRVTSVGLSRRLHAYPEVGFEEERAVGWVGDVLATAGFSVDAGIAGLPTALRASVGSGPLVLALVAEYDALPGVGHACGHNVIAAASVCAGLALAPLADDLGITLQLVGTPAEEGGGGKIVMLERGAFAGVGAAMMVHPTPREHADPPTLAVAHLDVTWTGREAHASAYPEDGVNAADAATVAQVAVGLLRQHLRPDDRLHGIVTHGGDAPNIVPGRTTASFYARSATLARLAELEPKLLRCFEAGALATGCSMEVTAGSPAYSEAAYDPELVAVYASHMGDLGRAVPVEVTQEALRSAGSTDMANVSLALPSIQPFVAIDSGGVGNHHPDFAAACATASADRAVLDGGVAMAWTAITAATRPALRERLLAGQAARGTGRTPAGV